jgi:transposase
LPAHLPRYEVVIDVESKQCPCCGGALHLIGEDCSATTRVVAGGNQDGASDTAWGNECRV